MNEGTTHADNCYLWGPKHYECALNEVRRLQRESREIKEELTYNGHQQQIAENMKQRAEAAEAEKKELAELGQKAAQSLRYIEGICKRANYGTDDMPVDLRILGYVKKLEAVVDAAIEHINEPQAEFWPEYHTNLLIALAALDKEEDK